ncbi:hypothetical protein [Streptomyces sp. NPDC052225]|uniref:hypothetical protein n=1 Tax=Streptomyces sp. NPDC052225 TaxID=3154949 RepID=UPI003413472E
MGLCIELLIVDCAYLEAVPVELRAELVAAAAFGPDDPEEWNVAEGWTWPDASSRPWYGRYEFPNTLTSYKPHFWGGEKWEEMRPSAPPQLRVALDEFSAPLFWGEYNWAFVEPPFTPAVTDRDNHWCPQAMRWLLPEDVITLRRFWTQVEPDLLSLREPFERHAAQPPTGPNDDFSAFAALVVQWGEVVTEAAVRGWGIIGLKC